jgi:hypothetical protein
MDATDLTKDAVLNAVAESLYMEWLMKEDPATWGNVVLRPRGTVLASLAEEKRNGWLALAATVLKVATNPLAYAVVDLVVQTGCTLAAAQQRVEDDAWQFAVGGVR